MKLMTPSKAPEELNWPLKCKTTMQEKEGKKEAERRKLWHRVWRTESLWQAVRYSEKVSDSGFWSAGVCSLGGGNTCYPGEPRDPQVALVVKNPPANVGDFRDTRELGLIRKIPWRRAWQPSPVFLPGESHGQRSLSGRSPQDHKERNTTEAA